jgi:hypothetical protein
MVTRTRRETAPNNSSLILGGVVIVALAALAYLFFFNDQATGTAIDVDLPNRTVEAIPVG